jgi:hypothetical protein
VDEEPAQSPFGALAAAFGGVGVLSGGLLIALVLATAVVAAGAVWRRRRDAARLSQGA